MIELTNCTKNCNCQKDNHCQIEPCEKQRLDFNELNKLVIDWAKNKDLIYLENVPKQWEKVIEEIQELYDELNKNNYLAIKDELGDVVVTLIILATQLNLTLEDCLLMAYNKIKDRKGKTIDGTFIKES